MKAKTTEEIKRYQKLAEYIREQYDYMDNMPSEGWFWEIIRRNPDYISDYNYLKEYAAKFDSDGYIIEESDINLSDDEFIKIGEKAAQCHNRISDTGLLGIYPRENNNYVSNQYIFLTLPAGPYNYLPNPNVKYSDFPHDVKPRIKGLTPIEVFTLETFMGNNRKYRYDNAFRETVLIRMEDKICVTISPSAQIKDIEDNLIRTIKQHLKPRKIKNRDDKWKYYLIEYDLTKQDKTLSYSNLADIMCNTYPVMEQNKVSKGQRKKKPVESKDYFTEQNCKNHYKAALALINGDYKEFLY